MEYTPIGGRDRGRPSGSRPRRRRTASSSILIDGNDVDEVLATAQARDRTRPGRRRTVADRGRDVSTWWPFAGRPGHYRPPEEVKSWLEKDPVTRTTGARLLEARRRRGDARPGRGRGSRRGRGAIDEARAMAPPDPCPRGHGPVERRRLDVAELTYRAAVVAAARPGDGARRDGRVPRRGRRRGGWRLQGHAGPARAVRSGPRPRHADRRAGDPGPGDGRRDDRPAAGRRESCSATSSPSAGTWSPTRSPRPATCPTAR